MRVFDSLYHCRIRKEKTSIFLVSFDPVMSSCARSKSLRHGTEVRNGHDPVRADVDDAGRTEMVTLETRTSPSPSCRACKAPRYSSARPDSPGIASSDADASGKQATAERSRAVDRVGVASYGTPRLPSPRARRKESTC
jgi:hypothetical protein